MNTYIALMLTFSYPIAAHAEDANNNSTSDAVSPREILRVTADVQSIHPSGGVVIILITYTYSYEPTNLTGRYITGVIDGKIKTCYGWHSANNLHVNAVGTTYSNNRQIAYIPVTYSVGTGSGTPIQVSDTLVLSLFG